MRGAGPGRKKCILSRFFPGDGGSLTVIRRKPPRKKRLSTFCLPSGCGRVHSRRARKTTLDRYLSLAKLYPARDLIGGSRVAKRVKTNSQVQDAILIESRRRCCICFGLERDFDRKKGQIAHLDGNPGNAAANNLVFLCWNHHDEFDSRTSQSKNLTQGEVRRFREELFERIRETFGQQSEGQQIEANDSPSLLTDAYNTKDNEENISELKPPSHWALRYKFDHPNPAHLGDFEQPSQELMVSEKDKRSLLFRDSAEDVRIFDIPEEFRDKLEGFGADRLTSLGIDGGAISVYARASGDLSVVTETYTDDARVEANWEKLKAHRTQPCFAAFAPDGSILLTGDEAGELIIWDWPARRKTHRLPSVVGPVASGHLNYRIDRAIVTGRNGTFEIFELSTDRALASGTARVKGENAQVHFSLDPAYLVAHDPSDRFDVLETATLKVAPENLWSQIWVNMKSDANEQVYAVRTVTGAVLAAVRGTAKQINRDAFEMLSPPGRRVSDYEISSDGERIAIMVERKGLLVWERVRT